MEVFDKICSFLLLFSAIAVLHKTFYLMISLFVKAKRYPETERFCRYAVVIAARNEENVVGNLIDSVNMQDYDSGLITVFVVADNCTDKTAEVCRERGANVYERFCPEKARKGYALMFLFENIEKDYGIEAFDGYFIFDADNLLDAGFITEMNKAFAAGNEVVTAYRNIKNFDANFVSSAYGLHFYRNSATLHRPRFTLGLGTHLTGTGYLISSRLLKDGWRYDNLTEDDQLTTVLCGSGKKIAFCEAAEFYDEQPVDLITMFKQRVRWARGRLACFFKHGAVPFASIFKHKDFTYYDIFTHYFPFGLISLIVGLVYPACSIIYSLARGGGYDFYAMAMNIARGAVGFYLFNLLGGIITVVKEYPRIKCPTGKLIFYALIFPWFDLLALPIYTAAIFIKVKWLPIIHKDARRITEIK